MKKYGKELVRNELKQKLVADAGHGLDTHFEEPAAVLPRVHYNGIHKEKEHEEDLKELGKEFLQRILKTVDTHGKLCRRWLKIELVGGRLFVAYILVGMTGNDDDDDISVYNT